MAFVLSTPYPLLNGSFSKFVDMFYALDIMKMCMKRCNGTLSEVMCFEAILGNNNALIGYGICLM